MSQASWDIEQIVQEVLAALQGQGLGAQSTPTADRSAPQSPNAPEGRPQASVGRAGSAAASPHRGEEAQQSVVEDGCLRIASRLVTMADLRACGAPENLAGVRRVAVRPDALVTPLVRDELQRRNIPLTSDLSLTGENGTDAPGTGSSSVVCPSAQAEAAPKGLGGSTGPGEAGTIAPAGAKVKWNLLLVIHGKTYEPAGLVRRLVGEGAPVEVRRMDCIVRATDQLAEAVRTGNCLGVLLTRYAAIGVCAANRHPGVRAVWGVEADQAASDTTSLGANLLVINPRQTPPYQLHKMIREFYQAGVRTCPEGLKSRLG